MRFPSRWGNFLPFAAPFTIAVALLLVLLTTATAVAAMPTSILVKPGILGMQSPSLFGSYWNDFVEFWTSSIRKQNSIVLLVLGVGAVALFIITRGKPIK